MHTHTHVDAFIPEFSAYCTPSLQIITQEHALPCHGKSCLVCGATPQLYRLLLETPTISMSIVSAGPDVAEEIMTLLLAGTAGLGSACFPERCSIKPMKFIDGEISTIRVPVLALCFLLDGIAPRYHYMIAPHTHLEPSFQSWGICSSFRFTSDHSDESRLRERRWWDYNAVAVADVADTC